MMFEDIFTEKIKQKYLARYGQVFCYETRCKFNSIKDYLS